MPINPCFGLCGLPFMGALVAFANDYYTLLASRKGNTAALHPWPSKLAIKVRPLSGTFFPAPHWGASGHASPFSLL